MLVAAVHLLGPLRVFRGWEPETLWGTLGDVCQSAKEKLLASVALDTTPAFYWDLRALGNTALVFSGDATLSGRLPEPSAEQLAWAVWEAELIYALTSLDDTPPEFDDEARAYVAALLHDAGFVRAPAQLELADEALAYLLSDVGREQREAGAPEQKERADAVRDYVRARADELAERVARL